MATKEQAIRTYFPFQLTLKAKQPKTTRVVASKASASISSKNAKPKVVKTFGSTLDKPNYGSKGANFNKSQS